MKLALLLALLSSTSSYSSGTTVGNGGDSLVCYNADQSVKSVTLFDYYEAKALRNIDIDLGAPSLSVDQKVNLVLDRIRRLNPNRAKRYELWFRDFYREAAFRPGIELVDIPDTGSGFYPADCRIKQTAVQINPTFPGDLRYTISQDLWDRMDNNSRAGLILHELIYREAVSPENRHTNSIAVRYYHSVMASLAANAMTLKDYISLLKLVKLRWADTHDGLPFPLFSFDAANNGALVWSDIGFHSDSILAYAPFDSACKDFGFPIKFRVLGNEAELDCERDPSSPGLLAYPYDNPTEGKPNRKEGFQYYSNGTIVSVFTKPKVFRFQKFATSLTIFANGLHLNSEAKLIAASYYDSTERRKGTLLEVHGTNLDLRFSGSLKDQLLQTYAGLSRDGHVSIVSSTGEVTGKFLSFDNQVLTAKTVIGQTEIGQTEFSFKPGTHLARSGNFEGTLLFPVEGRKIQIEHRYSFGADGIYSSAYLAEKIELKDTEGKWVTVPAHSHVTFRHGLLHYFYPGQDITP